MGNRVPIAFMHGLGNKILVVDMRDSAEFLEKAHVQKLCNFGASRQGSIADFDQIMVIYRLLPIKDIQEQKGEGSYRLEIWNKDGSKAKACGNGTRCVIHYLAKKTGEREFCFQTAGGTLKGRYESEQEIEVFMGKPSFSWQDLSMSRELTRQEVRMFGLGSLNNPELISMGNPHAVFFIPKDIDTFPLEEYGSALEKDLLFKEGCNISIVNVVSPQHIKVRTWERGAGLTKACGSAACASAVATILRGFGEECLCVSLLGGELQISWAGLGSEVVMTGPSVLIEGIDFDFQKDCSV